MGGIKTLNELKDSFTDIPPCRGIYRILLPDNMNISFTATIAGHSFDAYPLEKLSERYAVLKAARILYIGKASGKQGLRQRLRQYMNYGFNGGKNHHGGRVIFQIKGFENLLCQWTCVSNCEAEEHRLLQAFKQQYGDYPIANWRG